MSSVCMPGEGHDSYRCPEPAALRAIEHAVGGSRPLAWLGRGAGPASPTFWRRRTDGRSPRARRPGRAGGRMVGYRATGVAGAGIGRAGSYVTSGPGTAAISGDG